MDWKLLAEVYNAIIECSHSTQLRRDLCENRSRAYAAVLPSNLVKVAFDTRRINQSTDYNPRRNLQFYQRSEAFINDEISVQIKTFNKIKTAIDSIKSDFLGEPEWLDSYSRVLSASVDRVLRAQQQDQDFFKPQLDYLAELLYLRYRLGMEDIQSMDTLELRKVILSKDEKLSKRDVLESYSYLNENKELVSKSSPENNFKSFGDSFFTELFNIKATPTNKDVERSITITVRDKINEDIKKEG